MSATSPLNIRPFLTGYPFQGECHRLSEDMIHAETRCERKTTATHRAVQITSA